MRLILQDCFVVTLTDRGILPRASVVIEDGLITAIETSAPRRTGPEVVDCSHKLALPSLYNSHLHSEFLLMKGLLEERRLAQWESAPFYEPWWDHLEKTPRLDLLEIASRASYLEQALMGVGFVGEFNCADDSAELSARILEEVGLRGTATLKEGEKPPRGGKILPVGFVHHEGKITLEELKEIAALMVARPHQHFTLHAAENLERVQHMMTHFGARTVCILQQRGLLTPRLLLSHAVHLDEEERNLLARSGAAVVASPTSEMKLADGIAPLVDYMDRGIPVLLGTDCATCNNGADLFLELKTLGLLQKVHFGAHVAPAERLLATVTTTAATFWGDARRGRLEVGSPADICLLDRGSPALTPLLHTPTHSNVYANLVYAATGRDVTDLLVDGTWVVRNRQHTSLDLPRVMAELQRAAEELLGEGQIF